MCHRGEGDVVNFTFLVFVSHFSFLPLFSYLCLALGGDCCDALQHDGAALGHGGTQKGGQREHPCFFNKLTEFRIPLEVSGPIKAP